MSRSGGVAEPVGERSRLLEREGELAAVTSRVDAACDAGGSLVLVEGPAGIGKTRLLEATFRRAGARGMELLSASGSELERESPFGVVRQLFRAALDGFRPETRERLLAGAARPAAAVLADGVSGTDPGRPGTLPSILHGLYWLCANLTAEGPLALGVDDAHWADRPSQRWLRFMAARLDGLPLLIVAGLRGDETAEGGGLLEGLRREPGVLELRPSALSPAGVASLVRSELAPDAEDVLCAACFETTRGNPFLVTELVASLAAETPEARSPERVLSAGAQGVSRSVLDRLARLPPDGTAITQAVAVLGDAAELSIAARLAEVDYAAASAAADMLTQRQLLVGEQTLSFVHPLVRASVYESLAPRQRAAMHAVAARLLAETGAGADAVALHALASQPAADGRVVGWLRRAASRAASSGASDAAVVYLRRALAEPPPPGELAAVLRELGLAEAGSFAPEAEARLNAAARAADSDAERAAIALQLGRMLVFRERPEAAIEAFDRGIVAALAGGEREVALRLEAEAITAGTQSLDGGRLAAPRAARLAGQVGEGATHGERLVLAGIAWEQAVSASAPAEVVAEQAERALGGGQLLSLEGAEAPSSHLAAGALALCDRLAEAEAHFTDALAEARRTHSVGALAISSYMRSFVAFRRGALADAEADARVSIRLADEYDLPVLGAPISLGILIECLAAQGKTSEALEALARWGGESALPDSTTIGPLLVARGRVRALCGDRAAALEDFRRCGRLFAAAGIRNPGMGAWRSGEAFVLALLGETEEPRRLAEEEVGIARAFGAPRNLSIALRVAGLVTPGREGLALLEEAVAVLEGSRLDLELAYAHYGLGERIRAEGDREKAREPLRRALDLAHRCGATGLGDSVWRALVATGARPRRPLLSGVDALTPSERRIARLAAGGLTNREIAEQQFLTLRMVEIHLTRGYRKLGIASRAELAAALDGAARVDG